MDETIRRLTLDVLKYALLEDIVHHNQHSATPSYEMSGNLKALVRRALELGLDIEPPYDGYQYLDQARH